MHTLAHTDILMHTKIQLCVDVIENTQNWQKTAFEITIGIQKDVLIYQWWSRPTSRICVSYRVIFFFFFESDFLGVCLFYLNCSPSSMDACANICYSCCESSYYTIWHTSSCLRACLSGQFHDALLLCDALQAFWEIAHTHMWVNSSSHEWLYSLSRREKKIIQRSFKETHCK